MEKIINFTNTTNEDFVGMYHGEEFPVKAGETKTLTENVAKHIAGQLATYVLIRDKTVKKRKKLLRKKNQKKKRRKKSSKIYLKR